MPWTDGWTVGGGADSCCCSFGALAAGRLTGADYISYDAGAYLCVAKMCFMTSITITCYVFVCFARYSDVKVQVWEEGNG